MCLTTHCTHPLPPVQCTLRNPASSSKCSVCGAALPDSSAARALLDLSQAPHGVSESKGQDGGTGPDSATPWLCGVCTLVNAVNATQCTACGSPLPSSGGSAGSGAGAGVGAASGGGRGAGPSNPVSDLPPPLEWTCATCTYAQNAAVRMMCEVCGASRPTGLYGGGTTGADAGASAGVGAGSGVVAGPGALAGPPADSGLPAVQGSSAVGSLNTVDPVATAAAAAEAAAKAGQDLRLVRCSRLALMFLLLPPPPPPRRRPPPLP